MLSRVFRQGNAPTIYATLVAGLFLIFVAKKLYASAPLSWGDDALYRAVQQSGAITSFVLNRYQIWSGRIIIDTLTIWVIDQPMAWRLAMFSCFAALGFAITRSVALGTRAWVLLCACGGFFSISPEVHAWSIWWVTGSLNYFWPLAAASVCLLVYARHEHWHWWYGLSIPLAIFAASQEQAGVLVMVVEVAILVAAIARRRKLSWSRLTQLGGSTASFLLTVLAPGSKSRFDAMAQNWFITYSDLDFLERLLFGFHRALVHFYSPSSTLALVLAASMYLWFVAYNGPRWTRMVSMGAGILALLFNILGSPSLMSSPLASFYFNAEQYTPMVFIPVASVAPGHTALPLKWSVSYVGFLSLMLVGLGATLLLAAKAAYMHGRVHRTEARPAPFLIVLALGLSSMVGLTPSLYLSGPRIFLFQDFLLLFTTLLFSAGVRTGFSRIKLGIILLGATIFNLYNAYVFLPH